MAQFKVVVRKVHLDQSSPVYIRVTHKRKVKYLNTGKRVGIKALTKDLSIKDPNVLEACMKRINYYTGMLNKVEAENWDIDYLIKYLEQGQQDICFSDYAREYNDKMIREGHERNARTYELAYQHLERFAGTTKVMFSYLTTAFLNNWIKSLSTTARAKEQYPVCIRQIFKSAMEEFNDPDLGMVPISSNPWPKVKIPKSETPVHRAITMEECRDFFMAPLPDSDRKKPLSELGRDVAMMIICLAGINTIDLYYIKRENYKNNIITYERRKTRAARADNAYFEIRVPEILKPIIAKYIDKNKNSEYLFDFHSRFSSTDSFNANVNSGIRQICIHSLKLPHDKTYSAYTFRHTWATVAQNECGATLPEVDFGLNHAHRTRLARVYVDIDFSPAWILNEKVIDKIFFSNAKSKEAVRRKESENESFERFSFKQLMYGTLYFKGKVIATIEDVGFNNVNQIIDVLMKQLPKTVPPRSMVQIRIENKDKKQKKDYTRMT